MPFHYAPLVLAGLLAAILSFLAPPVRRFASRPSAVAGIAAGLIAVFTLSSWGAGAFGLPLLLMISVYVAAPVAAALWQGRGGRPSWLDFAAILMLWLPLEFAAGHQLIPKPAQGFLHSVAYGVAILLGLVIFLGFRGVPDLKFTLPRPRDLAYGVIAFVICAPVLILLGGWLGFIPAFHQPVHGSPASIGRTFGLIFIGTALPEEILFRSLIQNWLMERFGRTTAMLLVAALIFGAAHLDNGPQPLPNWRYMILATIAGIAYGKAFAKSSSVFSSVTCHALVDATKHIFF